MTPLQRLTNLSASDPGFYVVALSAYIEKILNNKVPELEEYNSSFSDKLYSLKRQILQDTTEYIPEIKSFPGIANDRKLSNGVRHNFQALNKEEAMAATHRFIQFYKLVNEADTSSLDDLATTLESWHERRDLKNEGDEFRTAKWEVHQAKQQNRRLSEELAELHKLDNEKKDLKDELKLTKGILAQLARKGLQSEKKNKELRDKRQALTLRLKEAETILKDYASAKSYSENLKKMVFYTRTRRDYESCIIRLSAEQKEVLSRIPERGDYLISGPAGTGKTFILMEAMCQDIKRRKESLLDEGSFLLLSFTRTLVKYNRYIKTIMKLDTRTDDKISTVDAFFNNLLIQVQPELTISYSRTKDLCRKIDCPDFFTPSQLSDELEDFIYAGAYSRKEYIDDMVSRRGMKTPLSRAQRQEVWVCKEQIESEMFESKLISKGYSRSLIKEKLPEPTIERIFIDEVQDISAAELSLLKRTCLNGLVLAGDRDQSIYSIRPPFKHSGIQVQGFSSILKTNFRSTRAIMNRCSTLRTNKEEISVFRDGPPPELFTAVKTDELYSLMEKRLQFLVEVLEYDPENIFILIPSRKFKKKIEKAVGNAGYKSVSLSDSSFNFMNTGKVRISTLHSSKGLDMPVVLLFLPHLMLPQQNLDEESTLQLKKNLLYVSMTRTMDLLNIFMKEENNDTILKQIKDAFENS